MLVTKLAGQALRPKRIGSLTLPLAAFGDRSNEALDIYEETKTYYYHFLHLLFTDGFSSNTRV